MTTVKFPSATEWVNNINTVNVDPLYEYSVRDALIQWSGSINQINQPDPVEQLGRATMQASSDVGIGLAEIINGDK
jgi:hypothetical protein